MLNNANEQFFSPLPRMINVMNSKGDFVSMKMIYIGLEISTGINPSSKHVSLAIKDNAQPTNIAQKLLLQIIQRVAKIQKNT